jgi:hypothetical protein
VLLSAFPVPRSPAFIASGQTIPGLHHFETPRGGPGHDRLAAR